MKLLVLDVEGTVFETKVRLPGTTINSTVWQGIAHELGPQAVREEVETHRRWHDGKYESYLDWMKDTINIHKRHGLTSALFENVISSAEYNPRVLATVAAIDRSAFEPVLISGGFRELAARAQIDLKINHAFAACEYFFSEDGALEAYNLLPCDFEGKIDFIRLMLREYRLREEDWVFVGDGLNDIPIAKAAPVSVAYAAHPELRNTSTFSIDEFSDLTAILARIDSTRRKSSPEPIYSQR